MFGQGYIDSASLHMLILALRSGKPAEWSQWTWETTQYVTCALWALPTFAVPPDPSPHKGAGGPYGQILQELSMVFGGIDQEDSEALRLTRQWTRRDPQARLALCKSVQDDPQFSLWLDSYMPFFWTRHVRMHGALFTAEFIPEISLMLGCRQADLERIHELSGRESQVSEWVKKRPDTESFRLASNAFAITTLLRGRYHDYAARNADLKIMHHPMREPLLRKIKRTDLFEISNTKQYVTNIIVAAALKQTGLKQKIHSWASNVLKVRAALRDGRIDLRPKDRDDVARDSAIDAVRKSAVDVHPKTLDPLLDILMGLSVGALTGFTLAPWVGVPAGSAAGLVSRLTQAPAHLVRRAYRARHNLQRLARSSAGRVQRIMTKNV